MENGFRTRSLGRQKSWLIKINEFCIELLLLVLPPGHMMSLPVIDFQPKLNFSVVMFFNLKF